MLLHAFAQGTGRQAQDRCGPVLALDFPVRRLEGPHDTLDFRLGKRLDSGNSQTRDPGFRKRVHQAQTGAPGVDHRPFDHVLQLPDVARPGVALQHLHGHGRHGVNGLARFAGKLLDEKAHQQGDVFPAVPERRHGDRKDLQAVVEIFAKPAAAKVLPQISIGRCDDPDVDPNRLRAAQALELAVLEHPQQLGLERRYSSSSASRAAISSSFCCRSSSSATRNSSKEASKASRVFVGVASPMAGNHPAHRRKSSTHPRSASMLRFDEPAPINILPVLRHQR